MLLAKAYNHYTGANITHRDVESWGILEETAIISSMSILAEEG